MIRQVHTLFEQGDEVRAVRFSPDGSILATSGGYRGNAIRLWDCSDWSCVSVLKGHKQRPSALSFVPGTRLLASGSADKTVRCWNCETTEETAVHRMHSGVVFDVACSPDGRLIASGGQDGGIVVWPISALESAELFATDRGSVNAITFSPRDRILATGGGVERHLSMVHIWNLESRRQIASLDGHSDWVLWVGFSADGTLLASGSYGEICLWDTGNWQRLQMLRRPADRRFSTIAFSFLSQKNLFLSGAWSHEEQKHEVRDAAGNLLGWNSTSPGLLQLWDLESGALLDCIEAHPDALGSMSYCSRTNQLATGGQEGAVKIWSLEPVR
jgi:WD40 repeat protein